MNTPLRLLSALVLALGSGPLAAVNLVGIYELAQVYDAELQAAEQRLAAAGEAPVQARAALLPSIVASGSKTLGAASATFAGRDINPADTDQEVYRISLSQSLYDDANYGRMQRARAELRSADGQYAQAWQDFLLRVSQRYFDVLTALDSLRFAKAEETALRRQFEQAEQRFEVGLAAVTDVHEARATFDGAQARVILAENALDDAREALREISGQMFDDYARLSDEIPLALPDPTGAEDWVKLALETSPALIQQRGQLDSAQADLRIARAGHLPTLALTGNLNRFVDNERAGVDPVSQETLASAKLVSESWQLGLTLEVPLFQGFAVQSRRRQAGYSLLAADEALLQVERQVIRQTENAFRAIAAGLREVQARRQALVSAESALEATNAGYEVGTRTIVDVLLAEQRFFQSERDYSQARHQFILNQLRLRQVAGRLEESDLKQVNDLLR